MTLKVDKISDNVWKFTGADLANFYFIDLGDEKIVIDTGNRSDQHEIKMLFGNLVDFNKITKVIFTHLHYDHTGNFDLFKKAEFFASQDEIDCLNKSKENAVLDKEHASRFDIGLRPLPEKIDGLEIIETPGHSKGSVCIWYPEKRILFTGDTLFAKKQKGRTDLPYSSEQDMAKSLIRLLDCNFRILAPGHDY